MEEKRILENILVAQTLVIAEQLRLRENKSYQTVSFEFCLKDAIAYIEKHRSDILTALRLKELL